MSKTISPSGAAGAICPSSESVQSSLNIGPTPGIGVSVLPDATFEGPSRSWKIGKRRGIALKVLAQNIDTSTPEGRLFFHMTAAFDEFQRELIVENTRAGLKAARKRGRRGGRPKAMDERTLKHAEAMLKDTENYPFISDVIDQLDVSRTAFYRYFPPDRIKQLRSEHA